MNPDVAAQLSTVMQDVTKQFQSLAEQMQNLASTLQRLATSGLSATAEGNKLSYAWTLLSRQLAAVTLPVVNFLVEKILQLTGWFQRLSGDGQFLLLKIGLIIASFTVLTPIISALYSILSPMAIAMGLLSQMLIYFFTETDAGRAVLDSLTAAVQWAIQNWQELKVAFETVVGGIVKAFQVVAAGFMWLGLKIVGVIEEILDWIPGLGGAVESIRKFREEGEKQYQMLVDDIAKPIQVSGNGGGGGPGRARQDVNPTGFAFESLSASFERITSEANKKDLARESLEVQKAQLVKLDKIAEGVTEAKFSDGSVGTGADY